MGFTWSARHPWALPHRQRQNRASTFKMELALRNPGLLLHPSAPSSEVPPPLVAPSHRESRGWHRRQRAHKGPPAWQPNRSGSWSHGRPGALFPGSYQPDLGVTEASRNGSRGQRFRRSSTQGTAPLWKRGGGTERGRGGSPGCKHQERGQEVGASPRQRKARRMRAASGSFDLPCTQIPALFTPARWSRCRAGIFPVWIHWV